MNRTTRSCTALLLTLAAATAINGCDDDPLVYQDDPDAAAAYQQLARDWLRWSQALPYTQSPIADDTGERCADGQTFDAWMLAGTFGGPTSRTCEIPADTPLFFPLVNRWIIPGLDPTDLPEDIPGFIEWVKEYFAWQRAHTCALTLVLDGQPLLGDTAEIDEELYVVVDEPFEVELNDDNWATEYGKQGGVYPLSFIDGHWALLEPLPPGDHTLEFSAVMCDGAEILFETSAEYELHVQSGGWGGWGGWGDDDDDQ